MATEVSLTRRNEDERRVKQFDILHLKSNVDIIYQDSLRDSSECWEEDTNDDKVNNESNPVKKCC